MNILFYLLFVAFVPIIVSQKSEGKTEKSSEEIVWEIPFDKAKVNYHRSRICITIKGKVNCISKNVMPGNPKEIADMFRILEKHTKLKSNKKDEGNNNSEQKSGETIPENRDEEPEQVEEEEEQQNEPEGDPAADSASNQQENPPESLRADKIERTIDYLDDAKEWGFRDE